MTMDYQHWLKVQAAHRGTAISKELAAKNPKLPHHTAYSDPPPNMTWEVVETKLYKGFRQFNRQQAHKPLVKYVIPHVFLQQQGRLSLPNALHQNFNPAFYIAIRNRLAGLFYQDKLLALYDPKQHAIYALHWDTVNQPLDKSNLRNNPWAKGIKIELDDHNVPTAMVFRGYPRSPFLYAPHSEALQEVFQAARHYALMAQSPT